MRNSQLKIEFHNFYLIFSEAYWKYNDKTLNCVKARMIESNFSDMEQKHLEEIHNFIEKHKLGVSILDLLVNWGKYIYIHKKIVGIRTANCPGRHMNNFMKWEPYGTSLAYN